MKADQSRQPGLIANMTDGTLGIVVADVSSHGFAPALIMALILTRSPKKTLLFRRPPAHP